MNALPSQIMLSPELLQATNRPTNNIESQTAIDKNIHRQLEAIYNSESAVKPEYAEKVAEANNMGFKPVMVEHDLSGDKGSNAKSFMGFNTLPYTSYYNMLRTSQYLLQAITPIAATVISASGIVKKASEHHNQALEAASADMNRAGLMNSDFSKNPHALDLFYKIEAGLITGVAMMRTSMECNHMVDDFRLSLAAEFGKDEADVNLTDCFQSRNPIIEIESKRMAGKFVSRFTSGAGFFFGLTTGLVTSALNIGAERTLFFANTPYDMLSKAVNDVQYNHLHGEVVQDILINDMQKSLQAMYADRGRNVVTDKEIQELRPTLSKVAQDIIDKRIGVESIFGIMGGGIIVVGDPAQSAKNYEFVSKNMMESVVEIAKLRKQEAAHAFNNIVQFKQREGGQAILPHDIATTARPDFVQAERGRIESRDFINMGIGVR